MYPVQYFKKNTVPVSTRYISLGGAREYPLKHLRYLTDEERRSRAPHTQRTDGEPIQAYYESQLLHNDGNIKGKGNALIVPYERLGSLQTIFPNLQIRNFECSEEYYYHIFNPHLRVQYDKVINMRDEHEVWENLQPVVSSNLHLDVIIDCLYPSTEGKVLEAFEEKKWRSIGTYREDIEWKDHIVSNPEILIHHLFQAETYRLPLYGGGFRDKRVHKIREQVQAALDYLKDGFCGCKIFDGEATIEWLNFPTNPSHKNILCEPGTEHEYALPVSSKEVAEWILDGSVTSGKVLLVPCRVDLDRRFKPPYDTFYWTIFDEHREVIFSQNAEIVVFYCNNASSHSPDSIREYYEWLKKKHPQSKQRCVLLENGINGLYRYFAEFHKEKLKEVFRIIS